MKRVWRSRPAVRAPRLDRAGLRRADQRLLRSLDRDFAEAARRAGSRLACRPGCSECCIGPFPITRLDVWRLRRGLEELGDALSSLLDSTLARVHLRVPSARYDIVSTIHREGEVLEEKYDESDVLVCALYPRRRLASVEQYVTQPW